MATKEYLDGNVTSRNDNAEVRKGAMEVEEGIWKEIYDIECK